MSGNLGYDNVKLGVHFACDTIASGIRIAKKGVTLWQNRAKIVEEVKDTQVEEVVDVVVTDLRQGLGTILEAVRS